MKVRQLLCGGAIVLMAPVSASAELIAHWDFENNLANTVSSSYGGVYTGSRSVTYSSDAVSGDRSFQFVNPTGWGDAPVDKISIEDGGNWTVEEPGGTPRSWTFTAWIKPTSSKGTVFSARSTESNYGTYVDIRNGTIQVVWNGGASADGGSGATEWGAEEGIWSMLAVVFDVSAAKIRLYRYTDATEGLVFLRDINVTTGFPELTNFKLGFNDGTSNGFGGFSGNMDGVRIFNQALSAPEILKLIPGGATAFFLTVKGQPKPPIRATLSDIGYPVYADSYPWDNPFTQPIYSPRGHTVAFRLNLQSSADINIKWQFTPFARHSDDAPSRIEAVARQLLPVHVEGNTQGSRINYPGGTAPEYWGSFLIRQSPFDLLEVVDDAICNAVEMAGGSHLGFVIMAEIPKDTAPGLYQSDLVLMAEGFESIRLPVMIDVAATMLPDDFGIASVHWLWPEPENLTSDTVPEHWSEPHWELLENSGRVLRRYGDNVMFTPIIFGDVPLIPTVKKMENSYEFDFSGFQRWISVFRDLGFEYFAGHHLASTLQPLKYREQNTGEIREAKLGTSEYVDILNAFLPELKQQLVEMNAVESYLQHQKDEPRPDEYELYKFYSEIKRQGLPDVTSIDAILGRDSEKYFEMADIHVLNLYGAFSFKQIIREHPGKYWLYSCTSPYPPLPNRHLDRNPLENRLWPLLAARLGTVGFLNWAANCYRGANEYSTSLGPMPSGSQNPGHPPGDAWFFYRGPDGLRPGIRMLNYREGMVDATLYKMLEERNEKLAHQISNRVVFPEIFQGFSKAKERIGRGYSLEAAQYNALRRELLQALDDGHANQVLLEAEMREDGGSEGIITQ